MNAWLRRSGFARLVPLLVLCMIFVLEKTVSAGESPSGKAGVPELIEGARKEGELNVFLVSSLKEKGARELKAL